MSDLDAGISEAHRKKKKKNSKSTKKGKARGSVSTDPVPVLVDGPLPHLFEPSVVHDDVGGPISITAVCVALSTGDSNNGDGDSEKKKKKKVQKSLSRSPVLPVEPIIT